MKIDIVEILEEIAQNEQENFKTFRDGLIEDCDKESDPVTLYRTLSGIELELEDFLNGRVFSLIDRPIIEKVLKTVKAELDIVLYKMRTVGIASPVAPVAPVVPQPVGEWEDDKKIQLIELIYAIYVTSAVKHRKMRLSALQRCFEYMFQVELGNISHRFYHEVVARKGKKLYLEVLNENLNDFILAA